MDRLLRSLTEETIVERVQDLICSGADLNVRNRKNETALLLAVQIGNVKSVRDLLQAKADVGDAKTHHSCLHDAVKWERLDILHTLLESKASVNATDKEGCTPLHVAVECQKHKAVRLLIMYQADVSIENSDGQTALAIASLKCEPHLLHGSDTASSCCSVGPSEKCELVLKQIETGFTPAMIAAEEGDIYRLKGLLEDRCDIHALNSDKQSSLHLAADRGQTAAVLYLVQAGCDVNGQDVKMETPWHKAAISSQVDSLRALIECNADFKSCDKDSVSFLDRVQNDECIHVLKMMGMAGWTPLMVAAENGENEIEHYFRLRGCLVALKSKSLPFPSWLRDEVQFYSALKTTDSQWTWGLHDKQSITVESNKLLVHKEGDSSDYSVVLGSEILCDGIHTWKIHFSEEIDVFAGIARGAETSLNALPRPYTVKEDDYYLLFGRNGASVLLQKGCSKQSSHIHCLSNFSVASGCIEFELDKHIHILSVKINGKLAVIASNVDDSDVRPCIYIRKSGTIHLIARNSMVRSNAAAVSADDVSAALDNTKWTEQTSILEHLIESGKLLVVS